MTPADRGIQRPLPHRDVGGPADQHGQVPIQAVQYRGGCEEPGPRGSQLDGEWQSIEANADPGDRTGVVGVQGERPIGCTGPLDEQRDGLVAREFGKWRKIGRIGRPQGQDLVGLLGGQMEHGSAGDHDAEARGPGEQIGHEGYRAEDLLEVIQDQEHLTLTQVLLDASHEIPVRSLPDTEGFRDRRAHRLRVVRVLEGYEDGAVGEPAGQPICGREGDPRLADTTRSREGQERPASHEVGDIGDLDLATDERCRRHGDGIVPGVHGADGRECPRQTLDHQLPIGTGEGRSFRLCSPRLLTCSPAGRSISTSVRVASDSST